MLFKHNGILKDNYDHWPAIIAILTVVAIIVCILGTIWGVNSVFPQLFYFPIILSVFFYPKKGFLFSIVLVLSYLGIVILLNPGFQEILATGVRAITLIGVALTVSILNTAFFRVKNRYQTLFETVPAPVVVIDNSGRITDINRNFTKQFGYTRDEILGNIFYEMPFIPDDKRELLKKKWKKSLISEIPEPYDIELNTKSGTPVVCRIYSSVFLEADDIFISEIIITDISRTVRSKQKIKENKKRFNSFFNNINNSSAILEVNKDCNAFIIKDINNACEISMKKNKADILGRDIRELYTCDAGARVYNAMVDICKTGISKKLETMFFDSTEFSGWKETYLYKLPSGEIVVIFDDISEYIQVRDELRDSLSEKDILLHEIHHRVKNNLQIISGILQLQKFRANTKEVSEPLYECITRIHAMARVQENIYRTGKISNINIAECLADLCEYLIYSSCSESENISLVLDCDQELTLDADRIICCALITNELLTNSLKHAYKPDETGKIEISFIKDDENNYVFSVKDYGVGIPDNIDFHRMDSLGMQLVINITTQLHGTIKHYNDQGTEFVISFPADNGKEENHK